MRILIMLFLFSSFTLEIQSQLLIDLDSLKQVVVGEWQIVGMRQGFDTIVVYPNSSADFELEFQQIGQSPDKLNCITTDFNMPFSQDTLELEFLNTYGWKMTNFPPLVLGYFTREMIVYGLNGEMLHLWDGAEDGLDIWLKSTSLSLIDDLAIDESEKIKIYPNPFVNKINLVNPENKFIERITIINMKAGTSMEFVGNHEHLNLDALPPGLFMLKLDFGDKVLCKQIVKVD